MVGHLRGGGGRDCSVNLFYSGKSSKFFNNYRKHSNILLHL